LPRESATCYDSAMIDSFIRALRLKDEVRSGWVLRGVRIPESVADHSWATSYLCMFYADEAGVDRGRAVQMAVVHDLAEAITGDVATRMAAMGDPSVIARKRQREAAAMDELVGAGARDTAAFAAPLSNANSPNGDIRELWDEYEEAATPVARFVRDMNLIDMCAQALVYEDGARYDPAMENANFPDFEGMDEFFATTRPRLSTPVGTRLFGKLEARYADLDAVKGRRSSG